MAADILRFSTEKDLSVTHTGTNIANSPLRKNGVVHASIWLLWVEVLMLPSGE
jgi:hypothetical protein